MELRKATKKDAGDCAEIVKNWISQTKEIPQQESRENLAKIIAEAIPKREVWLIGTPAEGYISLNIQTLQVTGLYVSNPGNGFGKKLLDKIKTDRKYLHLWSHTFNKRAHKFYITGGGLQDNWGKEKGDDEIPEIRFEWIHPGEVLINVAI